MPALALVLPRAPSSWPANVGARLRVMRGTAGSSVAVSLLAVLALAVMAMPVHDKHTRTHKAQTVNHAPCRKACALPPLPGPRHP